MRWRAQPGQQGEAREPVVYALGLAKLLMSRDLPVSSVMHARRMPVDADRRGRFGQLLFEYRYRAGLTQEQLAERAGRSLRGIQDLERGVRRTPHPATAGRVADALELDELDRRSLMEAARSSARTRESASSASSVPLARLMNGYLLNILRSSAPLELEGFILLLDGAGP